MATKPKRTDEQMAAAFRRYGSIKAAASALGIARSSLQRQLSRLGLRDKPVAGGSTSTLVTEVTRDVPKKGVKRYIVTCAQSNTKLNDRVWNNLLALREYYGAELLVSRFNYNQDAYLRFNTQKPGKDAPNADDVWFDPRIAAYICDDRHELAPGLVFCGELNILPTAVRPLSGLETYTGRKSAIVPHVKLSMESVASVGDDPTKFNYTTGTVTKLNYIQKKAGQKAEFHHSYGGLLVEVNSSGSWWVRQLNADSQGRIYEVGDRDDGCILAHEGKVTTGHRLEAINWGDIHVEELDPVVRQMSWGKGGVMDTMKPRYQFMHDTLSFSARNHHDRGNPHVMFRKWVDGRDCVQAECQRTTDFLNGESFREGCKTIVVDSNHDNALMRWLREADYKTDPVNARFFLQLQARVYEAIESKEAGFHLVEHTLRSLGCAREVRFLREDESFVLCRDNGGGIEAGMHGHLGVNGSKGAPLGLSKMGRRANTGHTHVAGIIDGLYTSGTKSRLRLPYSKGPSAWSHSDIFTYPNGKRTIVTAWRGAWRAA